MEYSNSDVKEYIKLRKQANKFKTYSHKMQRAITIVIQYYSLIRSKMFSDFYMQNKAEILSDLEKEFLIIINELKKDKKYLKEIKSLYNSLSKNGDNTSLLIVVLNALFEKEEHLEDRTACLLVSTEYALDGVNCYIPDFVNNNSQEYNDDIEKEISLIKKV